MFSLRIQNQQLSYPISIFVSVYSLPLFCLLTTFRRRKGVAGGEGWCADRPTHVERVGGERHYWELSNDSVVVIKEAVKLISVASFKVVAIHYDSRQYARD